MTRPAARPGAGRPLPPGAVALLLGLAVAGLLFQVVHFAEHLLQVAYLLGHAGEQAWMTPWGAWTRDRLAEALSSSRMVGMEVLHLLGNAAFLAGLVALDAHGRVAGTRGRVGRWLTAALAVQGLHVVEHVALTASVIATGHAAGATTLLGALHGEPGFATWFRVWAHFLLNLVGSAAVVVALWRALVIADGTGGRELGDPLGAAPGSLAR
ncbi:MAG: hypothetical protein FJZ92_04905 [Chloroflexi bacterium]|nr:hypothetical protein [Chloroflexota bacterium]